MRLRGVAVATGILCCASGCGSPRPELPAPVVGGKPSASEPGSAQVKAAPARTKAAPPGTVKPPARALKRPPDRPAARPTRADSLRLESALLRERSHAPLAHILSRRSGNQLIADRAAAAVLRESQRARLSPSFVAAVLMVENTPMDSTAVSVAGAIGLMQVMPVHEGGLGCPSAELLEVESNICHGTRLLRMYLRRHRTVQAALRRYNGCVGALATRTCLRYPARVQRTASSIRRELLSLPADEPALAAPPPPRTGSGIAGAP
jgi:soluble lytic murein transglycosylase-like protein